MTTYYLKAYSSTEDLTCWSRINAEPLRPNYIKRQWACDGITISLVPSTEIDFVCLSERMSGIQYTTFQCHREPGYVVFLRDRARPVLIRRMSQLARYALRLGRCLHLGNVSFAAMLQIVLIASPDVNTRPSHSYNSDDAHDLFYWLLSGWRAGGPLEAYLTPVWSFLSDTMFYGAVSELYLTPTTDVQRTPFHQRGKRFQQALLAVRNKLLITWTSTDEQLLVRALSECGNALDVIKRLPDKTSLIAILAALAEASKAAALAVKAEPIAAAPSD